MNEQLPRLPEAVDLMQAVWRGGHEFMRPVGSYYTADQMRDYVRAALAAQGVPVDPCLVLWQAMNEAEKVGNRTDDKLIVEFLRRAGYGIAAATPAQAQQAAELLPCPFCGSHVIAREGYHMTCLTCGAEGTDADEATDNAAAAAWNRRAKAKPEAQQAKPAPCPHIGQCHPGLCPCHGIGEASK